MMDLTNTNYSESIKKVEIPSHVVVVNGEPARQSLMSQT